MIRGKSCFEDLASTAARQTPSGIHDRLVVNTDAPKIMQPVSVPVSLQAAESTPTARQIKSETGIVAARTEWTATSKSPNARP